MISSLCNLVVCECMHVHELILIIFDALRWVVCHLPITLNCKLFGVPIFGVRFAIYRSILFLFLSEIWSTAFSHLLISFRLVCCRNQFSYSCCLPKSIIFDNTLQNAMRFQLYYIYISQRIGFFRVFVIFHIGLRSPS